MRWLLLAAYLLTPGQFDWVTPGEYWLEYDLKPALAPPDADFHYAFMLNVKFKKPTCLRYTNVYMLREGGTEVPLDKEERNDGEDYQFTAKTLDRMEVVGRVRLHITIRNCPLTS